MEALFQQFTRERQYVHNVSPRTLEMYWSAWKAFAPALSEQSCVSKTEVQKRIEELRARGLSPVSVNTYLRTVNAFCHWLHEEGHSTSLLRIPRLKEQQSVSATLTQEHVAKLVGYRANTWTGKRIQVLACLVLDTGLRINEELSLNRQTELDLDQATATVRCGKGGKSRIVPISHQMRRLLFRFSQTHQPKYGNLLFYSHVGEPLTQRNALRDFKLLCKRLEMTGVRCSFHTLRHSFALAYAQLRIVHPPRVGRPPMPD